MEKNKSLQHLIIPERRRVIKENELSLEEREDLLSVEMPDSVTVIKDSAFWGCRNLETVKLSKKLKTIGPSAFKNCYNLKSITLPEGLESIADSAFFKCFELKKIVIPQSVKSIGEYAFGQSRNLTIMIPKHTSVSENAFHDAFQCTIERY